MKRYAVSVITPFHNVKPEVFEKCRDSVLAQTIGFENIEWIVVVHNCDECYRTSVFDLLAGHENIIVHVLDNDRHTPSSPRNLGIELAHARYLSFLDADDRFTPECLAKALYHMKKTDAQITWFRREFELESEDSVPITEIVLWDQTQEEIILDRDHRDDEKMFSGICGMVTSRIYDKQFLDAHGIRFDETVPFAEDYLFNIECYGHADKLCYLPQMIGYHYYINSASLVQKKDKDPQYLIAIARGYQKVFDAGLKYGFYMNAIILGLCCVLARFMIATRALTLKDRFVIRDLLAPYLESMEPLRVNKIYSEKAVRERYEFPRAVILDPENYHGDANADTLIAVDYNTSQSLSPYQQILRNILNINYRTDMGRRYGFTDILTLSGYREKLPETSYDLYEPLFRLQTNIGESGIITADPVRSYMLTLGSMENPRLIPCTDRQLAPLRVMLKNAVKNKRTFLMLESLPQKHRFNDNAAVNTIYGAVLSGLFEDNSLSVRTKRSMFTTPHELLFPGEIAEMAYLRLLFALRERSVDQIIAPNTWEVWESFRFLEKNWKNLCADIASGKPEHYRRPISDEFKADILGRLKPDPERAAELTAIFEQGFERPVIPQIWPAIKGIIAFGDAAFRIYTIGIRRYTGALSHSNGFYMASTALLGTETQPGVYRMSTSNAFIEFVPVSGGEAVFAPQVEAGRDYRMLISTYSGLYRYRLRDTVRIESVENGVPSFSYRCSYAITLHKAGLELDNGSLCTAMLALREQTGVPITDYACKENDDGSGIIVLTEINDDATENLDAGLLSQKLDELLREQSADYRRAAEDGRLTQAQVLFMEQETQLFYRDMLMNRINRPTDMITPVRFINTPLKERFFMSRLLPEQRSNS